MRLDRRIRVSYRKIEQFCSQELQIYIDGTGTYKTRKRNQVRLLMKILKHWSKTIHKNLVIMIYKLETLARGQIMNSSFTGQLVYQKYFQYQSIKIHKILPTVIYKFEN